MEEIAKNIVNAIEAGGNNSIVNQIMELQEEMERIDLEIEEKKKALLEYMDANDIKTVKTKLATVTLTERKNVKVDEDNAWEFLDSQNLSDEFRKLDKTKFTKMWPTHELITEGKPTKYITIKGA